jgi:hypothetical protein
MTLRQRRLDLGPRRVEQADQAQQLEVDLEIGGSFGRLSGQSLRAATAMTRRPFAAMA